MKSITLSVVAMFICTLLWSQAPQAFKYQAVARDGSGNILADKSVSFKISILSGSASGNAVYSETHTKKTNAFGLVDLEIGKGTLVTGTFSSIPWGNSTYFLKVELDPSGGSSYVFMGSSQLLSVPYALHAKTVEQTPVTDATLEGKGTTTTPLRIAQQGAASGQTLKWNGTSWAPGTDLSGNTSPGGETSQVQFNNAGVFGGDPDFVWDKTNKRLGIGVSGAAAINSPLDVRNLSGNAIIGVSYNDGAGVYGFDMSTTGSGNSGVMGQSTAAGGIGVKGVNNKTSGPNFGIYGNVASPDGYSGYFTGGKFYVHGNTGIIGNVGIGNIDPLANLDIYPSTGSSYLRLKSNDAGALLVLDQVGDFNNHMSFIVFRKAGTNTFVTGMNYDQYQIYNSNSKGLNISLAGDVGMTENLFLGDGKKIGIGTSTPGAGLHVKGSGFPNSFIFMEAPAAQDAGLRFYEGATAKWHLFNNAAAGGLQIYNSAAATAIFCKQSNSYVGINTTTPNYNLEVNGTAGKTGGGSWTTSSDIRLKIVKGKYNKGLIEIMQLQPVLFTYKAGNPRNLPSDTEQIGFVAQDVQKVFPEAVTEAKDGYLDFNIHAINVALINAVKDLKAENEQLKAENARLQTDQKDLSARIVKIESMLVLVAKK